MQTGIGASLADASLTSITGYGFVRYNQRHSMRWAPIVPIGALPDRELNGDHDDTARLDALRTIARQSTAAHNNPFFGTLHILEQLKAMPR